MPQFRLIDGNAIGWLLHSAAAREFSANLGIEVQGARAFAGFLASVGSDRDCLNVVLWDGRAQWRYDLCPDYKSGRHRTNEQRESRRRYEAARPWLYRWADLAPVVQATHPHGEADDLAYRMASALSRAGYSVELLTRDSDWQQLVDQKVVWRSYGKAAKRKIVEDFAGESPVMAIAHAKALSGDTADTIDGVKGIGPARALQLLKAYGSLDGLLAAAQSLEGLLSQPRWAHGLSLPENIELVRRNQKLIELSLAPALDTSLTEVRVGAYDFLAAVDLCEELGFEDWLDDFPMAVRGIDRDLPLAPLRTWARLSDLTLQG